LENSLQLGSFRVSSRVTVLTMCTCQHVVFIYLFIYNFF